MSTDTSTLLGGLRHERLEVERSSTEPATVIRCWTAPASRPGQLAMLDQHRARVVKDCDESHPP